MFTEDVFAFYGGTMRFGEHAQVQTGRLFVVILTLIAYAVAISTSLSPLSPQSTLKHSWPLRALRTER